MSTNNSQQIPSGPEKSCCRGRGTSILIWIILVLVILVVLWVCFTQRGQEMMGNVLNKGAGELLTGLSGNQSEQDAAAALEKCGVIMVKDPQHQTIGTLNFGNVLKPGDEVLKQLAKLRHLQSANLAQVEINDDQLAYLGNLQNLTSLVLNGTQVTDAGLVHLIGLPVLNYLHLSHINITNKGLEQIAKIPSLVMLDLSYTNITDQGIKQIIKLNKINWLLIHGTKITDAGLVELKALPELQRLTLSKDMKVSSDVIDQLKQKFPTLHVDLADPPPAEEPATVPTPEETSKESEADKDRPAAPTDKQ